MIKKKQRKVRIKMKRTLIDMLVIAVASLVYAFGVRSFIEPNGIIAGGITGIVSIITSHTSLPFGPLYGLFNLPLIILAFIYLGRMTVVKTIVSVAVITLATDFVPFPAYEVDSILSAVFGGIILGAGVGFVYSRNGTSGGTDIINKIINKKRPDFSMGNIAMTINAIIVLAAMIINKGIESGLYSLIFFFVSGKMLDFVLYGNLEGKLLFVFSDKYREISDAILADMNRGVTLLSGHGAYSGEDKNVICCVVQKNQYAKLKILVSDIDKTAFIVASNAVEIFGKGFHNVEKM